MAVVATAVVTVACVVELGVRVHLAVLAGEQEVLGVVVAEGDDGLRLAAGTDCGVITSDDSRGGGGGRSESGGGSSSGGHLVSGRLPGRPMTRR